MKHSYFISVTISALVILIESAPIYNDFSKLSLQALDYAVTLLDPSLYQNPNIGVPQNPNYGYLQNPDPILYEYPDYEFHQSQDPIFFASDYGLYQNQDTRKNQNQDYVDPILFQSVWARIWNILRRFQGYKNPITNTEDTKNTNIIIEKPLKNSTETPVSINLEENDEATLQCSNYLEHGFTCVFEEACASSKTENIFVKNEELDTIFKEEIFNMAQCQDSENVCCHIDDVSY